VNAQVYSVIKLEKFRKDRIDGREGKNRQAAVPCLSGPLDQHSATKRGTMSHRKIASIIVGSWCTASIVVPPSVSPESRSRVPLSVPKRMSTDLENEYKKRLPSRHGEQGRTILGGLHVRRGAGRVWRSYNYSVHHRVAGIIPKIDSDAYSPLRYLPMLWTHTLQSVVVSAIRRRLTHHISYPDVMCKTQTTRRRETMALFSRLMDSKFFAL